MMSSSKHRIHWDQLYAQWCELWFPTFDLNVLVKPVLGELPIEADLVVITETVDSQKRWKKHPLWQYFTPVNLLEFKSVHDAFETFDLEKLMAYIALYRGKYLIDHALRMSGWLIIPHISRKLRQALSSYRIELIGLNPGFWRTDSLHFFDLFVVEYERLPVTADFFDLKLFTKQSKSIVEALQIGLEVLGDSKLGYEYIKIGMEIHPLEVLKMMRRSAFSIANLPYFLKKRSVWAVFCPELAPMTYIFSFLCLGRWLKASS
jgi:hypothetical protein